MPLRCPFDALASVLIRSTCKKTEDKLLYLKPLWKFRSIDFSPWRIIFLSVRPSVAKGECVGTSRLFLLLTLSLRAPSSPIPSSPLYSGQEQARGSYSGDIIMSHFTRVLPSISPWININHPSAHPQHTQQPFHLHTADDNVESSKKREKSFRDWSHRTSSRHNISFLPFKSFCPSGFAVQTTFQDIIVPNNRWRSRPLSNTSPFWCPVLLLLLPLFSRLHSRKAQLCLWTLKLWLQLI